MRRDIWPAYQFRLDPKSLALTQEPSWQAHARAMNQAFAQLEQRQLNNIRVFRAENIAPATQQSHTCVYLFSGPDFLYADAMFSDCSTFVLQGLEPVDPLPDLATVPPATLAGTLQNIEISLNTILSFSFFKTKDMREDFERSQLKGVLPAIFVFLARTGKEMNGIEYISLDKAGAVVQGFQGATRGAKITFTDTATGSEKVLYYFTSDLSDEALKRNSGLLRFCRGPRAIEQFAEGSFLPPPRRRIRDGAEFPPAKQRRDSPGRFRDSGPLLYA